MLQTFDFFRQRLEQASVAHVTLQPREGAVQMRVNGAVGRVAERFAKQLRQLLGVEIAPLDLPRAMLKS